MSCYLPVQLYCLDCKSPLAEEAGALACPQGHTYPVVGGIPRFVPANSYANSFGLQWNTFRKTQLDSHTGVPISQKRLERILGAPLSTLRGKTVLEAGCGAGRFTELLLNAGAKVLAADLSSAVEANLANCSQFQDYAAIQADIRKLPVAQGFDLVMCIGVIQHTPNSEETITALAGYVRPGGMLLIDHYGPTYPVTASRNLMRKILVRLTPETALKACELTTDILWPLHEMTWKHRAKKGVRRLNGWVRKLSPLVDYHEAYPELGRENLRTWAFLDTHDTVTDHFKHLRNPAQIRDALASAGMASIEVWLGGNGVEARATKPGA